MIEGRSHPNQPSYAREKEHNITITKKNNKGSRYLQINFRRKVKGEEGKGGSKKRQGKVRIQLSFPSL